MAKRRAELAQKIEEKRLYLLKLKQEQLEARKQQDPALEAAYLGGLKAAE